MVASDGERKCTSQTVRFQETLRRLAMIDEGFVEDEARLGLGLVRTSAVDPKTAALLQVGVSVAIGSSTVCLEWSAARAMAAGANEDEIADVLLAIARWPGSAGSSPLPPMWRPSSDMTSRPRWRNQTATDGSSADRIRLPADRLKDREPHPNAVMQRAVAGVWLDPGIPGTSQHAQRLRINSHSRRPACSAASESAQRGHRKGGSHGDP
jgi:alkylhydroperoxidase/carboxymuconolactone decarboxylase family protein YurZ